MHAFIGALQERVCCLRGFISCCATMIFSFEFALPYIIRIDLFVYQSKFALTLGCARGVARVSDILYFIVDVALWFFSSADGHEVVFL